MTSKKMDDVFDLIPGLMGRMKDADIVEMTGSDPGLRRALNGLETHPDIFSFSRNTETGVYDIVFRQPVTSKRFYDLLESFDLGEPVSISARDHRAVIDVKYESMVYSFSLSPFVSPSP